MTADDSIANVDLTGSDYVIEQNLLRTECRVYDDSSALLLQTKRRLFETRKAFAFLDTHGRPVYTVDATSAGGDGDYTLTEAGTDDDIAVLETDFTAFEHVWRVRSPDGDRWAVIESQRPLSEIARNVTAVIGWPPHEFTITGPGGEAFGRLEGRFSLRDVDDLHVGDSGDAPKESLVAAAIAVAVLERA